MRRDGATIVAVRVSVRAAGVFRLRFREDRPSGVDVTEVWTLGDDLDYGLRWEASGAFESRFVEPGETLSTTVIFPVEEPQPGLAGWLIGAYVTAARFGVKGEWVWDDRIFVPWTG